MESIKIENQPLAADDKENLANLPAHQSVTRYHVLVFVGCWLGGIFDGMDSTLMTVAMPIAIKELIGSSSAVDVGQIGSVVSSIFLLGWMVGGILFGIVGDKLGRVRSMVLSILIYAFFTGFAGLAQNWEQLAFCRFLTGLGIGGELVSIATFLTEVWPERSRSIAIGVLLTSYQAGVFLAGSLHYFVPNWRHAFFIGAVPALLVFLIRTTMKESDRWVKDQEARLEEKRLAEQQRSQSTSEALQAAPSGYFATLFQSHQTRSLIVGSVAFAGLLIGYWASLSWIPTWIQSLLDSQGGISNGPERSMATMCQGMGAILGCISAGFLCNVFGRKWTLIVGYLLSIGASGWLFLTNPTFTPIIYMQSGVLGFMIGLIQAGMYIYLPELFKTRIRATATGFCLNCGRLLTAIAVFFVGTVVQILGGYALAAFVFSLAYAVSALAIVGGTETRGRPLQD
jgi:MFS family permease